MGSKSVLIDRGNASGVRKGMAVVTPDGIVGKVLAVYPFASQVLSVTDPGFAAGVESQKNHVHGVLKGLGNEKRARGLRSHGAEGRRRRDVLHLRRGSHFPQGLPVG